VAEVASHIPVDVAVGRITATGANLAEADHQVLSGDLLEATVEVREQVVQHLDTREHVRFLATVGPAVAKVRRGASGQEGGIHPLDDSAADVRRVAWSAWVLDDEFLPNRVVGDGEHGVAIAVGPAQIATNIEIGLRGRVHYT